MCFCFLSFQNGTQKPPVDEIRKSIFQATTSKDCCSKNETARKLYHGTFLKARFGQPLQKQKMVAVISDGQTCTKLTQFEQFGTKMKDGNTYIIRGHSIRGYEPPYFINVKGRTIFFHTIDMEVRKDLHREAEALLHPCITCHSPE